MNLIFYAVFENLFFLAVVLWCVGLCCGVKLNCALQNKVYNVINEDPDAVHLNPLPEIIPKNKAVIEFHAIACAGKA